MCMAASSGWFRAQSHICQGTVVQEMSIFSNMILASSIVSSFGFCQEKSSPLPWALPIHIRLHFGASLCPSPQEPLNMRRALKGRILSSLDRSGVPFFFFFLLRVACRCGKFCSFPVRPSSFSSQCPPGCGVGFTCFSSTSCALWGPDCSRPGPWSNFPPASSLL